MHDINPGAALARERRAAGIAQGELAARLGVTKAAVSKWDLGPRMPDVAQLPRIAAFFALTLDELFGYCPQLREEEVLARALELFERVEAHADDVELACGARMMRAALLNMQGDADGAIELMESLKSDIPMGVEMLLAGMCQLKGYRERSLRLYRATAYLERFVSLIEALDEEHVVLDARKSVLYDRAPRMAGVPPDQVDMANAQLGTIDVRQRCAQAILVCPEWAERADAARFGPLLDRLEAIR